eukprot:gb/GECG01006849.1/.p1 GENE.gb/GECG01006849.1/~~gb/GECG01006849.1/.p1  ORF type:complete len:125 (+),score=25.54 gb/GECG01006849.1/:1-375(+)
MLILHTQIDAQQSKVGRLFKMAERFGANDENHPTWKAVSDAEETLDQLRKGLTEAGHAIRERQKGDQDSATVSQLLGSFRSSDYPEVSESKAAGDESRKRRREDLGSENDSPCSTSSSPTAPSG